MTETPEALTKFGLGETPPLRVECPEFTGSLATLFHMAREGRVDLTGIPLYPLCRAYVEYLYETGCQRVDEASSALLALAYLIERKAWALLPLGEPPPEEEPVVLPEPTVHLYSPAIEELAIRQAERSLLYFRSAEVEVDGGEVPLFLGDVRVEDLAEMLQSVLLRAVTPPPFVPRQKWPSLREVMRDVRERLHRAGGEGDFTALLPENYTRMDAVFVFLAMLEMLRLGLMRVEVRRGVVWFRLKNQSEH
jgi:chromatin segregation and condensation protein Rec8/ScpA/Scc1 (kleisin family)